jgi:hypothetical protein
MMNNKGEWYARDWILAVLFFSGAIVIMAVVGTDMLNTYDRNDLVDSEFSQKYDKFQNTTDDISTMFTSISGSGGLNPISFTELIFSSVFTIIQLVFASIGVFNGQIASIFTDLGVPTVISYLIGPIFIGAITVTIIFIVVTSTARNKI